MKMSSTYVLVGYGAGYMGNHPIPSTPDSMAMYQVYLNEIMFKSASYVAYMPIYELCDQ